MVASIPIRVLVGVMVSSFVGRKKLTYFLCLCIFWRIKWDLLISAIHVFRIRFQSFILGVKDSFIFVISILVSNDFFWLLLLLCRLFSILLSEASQHLLLLWPQKAHFLQILQLQNLFSVLSTAVLA